MLNVPNIDNIPELFLKLLEECETSVDLRLSYSPAARKP